MAPLNPYAPPYIQNPYQLQLSLHPPQHLVFDQTLATTLLHSLQPPHDYFYYVCPNPSPTENISKNKQLQPPLLPFNPPICSKFEGQDTGVSFPLSGEVEVLVEDEKKEVLVVGESDEKQVRGHRNRWRGNGSGGFRSFRCGETRRWRPPVHHRLQRVALKELEFKDEDGCGVEREKTTVMIKNLPNKMSKGQLLDLLDEHCRNENEKIPADTGAIFSEFDFLYLPIDFSTGNNLGYAFVNFTTCSGATRLYNFLHFKDWASFGSRKVCEVTYARFQGLSSLIGHFIDKEFHCDNREYLPVRFSPNRNGFSTTVEEYVAKLRSNEPTAL